MATVSKKKILLSIPIAIIILLTATIVMSLGIKKDLPEDIASYPAYYTDVLEDKKPIFAFFYTDWCTHCVNFLPVYAELEKYYKGKYNFIKINVDDMENKYLAQDFYIISIPTVYIINPMNKKRYSIHNYYLHDIKALKKEMGKYLKEN